MWVFSYPTLNKKGNVMNPITLPVAELKPALTGLGKLIHTRTSSTPLQCVKVERTSEGWIALTTTDQDHFITVRLEQPAEGKPLSMLVPFDALVSLTKDAAKGECLSLVPH